MIRAPSFRRLPAGTVPLLAGAALLATGLAVGLALAPGRPLPRAAALTALGDESFVACTAPLDAAVEGFFVLDFETGDLSGGVLNQNTSKFGVSYRTNVLKDLEFKAGRVKNPRFLMVPGLVTFAGNAAGRWAQSVLYVTDASTGVTVAYGIPWNQQQGAAGAGVVAELMPLDKARPRGGAAKAP